MKPRKRTWTNKDGKKETAWQFDYKDAQGKRRRAQRATKAEAEAAMREIAVDLKKGTAAPGAAEYTIGEILNLYFEALENGTRIRTNEVPRPSTIEGYRGPVGRFVRPQLENTSLSRFGRQDLARFRDWLVKESGAGVRDREVALQQLKAALDEAEARELVSGGWWRTISISRQKTTPDDEPDDAPEAIPSDEEIRQLIATGRAFQAGDFSQIWSPDDGAAWRAFTSTSGPRGWKQIQTAMRTYAPAIELDVMTGLRVSELLALQARDIDLQKQELRVRRSIDRKGRVYTPKTSAGLREIPLPDAACELLEPQLQERDCKDWVFATANGTPLGYFNLYHKGWTRLIERAGIQHYRLHALRHYYASCLIAAGADALEVKEMLGHADVATTMNIYGHLLRSDASKRRQRVERVTQRFSVWHKFGTESS